MPDEEGLTILTDIQREIARIINVIRQAISKQQRLHAAFGAVVTDLDHLENIAHSSLYATSGTHTPAAIRQEAHKLLQEAKGVWNGFRNGISASERGRLTSYLHPTDRLCERYITCGAFQIQRVNSRTLTQFSGGRLATFGNDFWPTAIAGAASFLAAKNCFQILTTCVRNLLPGPTIVSQYETRHNNLVKLFHCYCSLVKEFRDNLLRAIYAKGYDHAASGLTSASNWAENLPADFSVLFYGSLPDFQGHDNSHYRPYSPHGILLIRPYLEAVTALNSLEQKCEIPTVVQDWLDGHRGGDRTKGRLKFYVAENIITPSTYAAAIELYSSCSETIHGMMTRFVTDAWVAKCFTEHLKHDIIVGLKRFHPPQPEKTWRQKITKAIRGFFGR